MKAKATYLTFLLLAIVLVAGCVGQQANAEADEGRVVFAMKDHAEDLQSVTSIEVTVDQIMVHSESKGWITVSTEDRTYDLLQLRAQESTALLADVELEEGTYTQLRLDISKVVVTDSEGKTEAKLPSSELKIVGNLVVEENSTSTATFDFIADESLYITGNDKYILAPVVQLETRQDAEVEVKSSNTVEITGGTVTTDVKVGMDVNGNVGIGISIPADTEIDIGVDGIISIGANEEPELIEEEPSAPTAPMNVTVEMSSNGFSPSPTTIKIGGTITFKNMDVILDHWPASAMHPTHTVYPGSGIDKCGSDEQPTIFDACRGISPGNEWSFTFNSVGEWNYHDHLSTSLFGKIIVVE